MLSSYISSPEMSMLCIYAYDDVFPPGWLFHVSIHFLCSVVPLKKYPAWHFPPWWISGERDVLAKVLSLGNAGMHSDRLGRYGKISAHVFSSYQFKFRKQPFWSTWSNPLAEPYRGQRLAVLAQSWQGTPPGLVLTQQKPDMTSL